VKFRSLLVGKWPCSIITSSTVILCPGMPRHRCAAHCLEIVQRSPNQPGKGEQGWTNSKERQSDAILPITHLTHARTSVLDPAYPTRRYSLAHTMV